MWYKLVIIVICSLQGIICKIPSRKRDSENIEDGGAMKDELAPLEIKISGTQSAIPGQYLCTSISVSDRNNYIIGYTPLMKSENASQDMELFGCRQLYRQDQDVWECENSDQICARDKTPTLLYAWTNHFPPLRLPPNVGYGFGGETEIDYLLLRMHYLPADSFPEDSARNDFGLVLKLTDVRPQYHQGSFQSFNCSEINTSAKTGISTTSILSTYRGRSELFPFGFRAKANDLSRVMIVYIHNPLSGYQLIGKSNSKCPGVVYPTNPGVSIKLGDVLIIRCIYDSPPLNHATRAARNSNGANGACFIEVLYYTNGEEKNDLLFECLNVIGSREIVSNLPTDSDLPLDNSDLVDCDKDSFGTKSPHSESLPSITPRTTARQLSSVSPAKKSSSIHLRKRPNSVDNSSSDLDYIEEKIEDEEEAGSGEFGVSIFVGCLLLVPIIVIVVIALVRRFKRRSSRGMSGYSRVSMATSRDEDDDADDEVDEVAIYEAKKTTTKSRTFRGVNVKTGRH